MSTRRAGSIRPRFGKWIVRLYVGRDGKGKKVYTHETADTERLARARLAQLVKRQGESRDGVRAYRGTLGEWLTEWVREKRDLAPRTLRDLSYFSSHYVPRGMQAVRLTAVTDAMIETWVTEMATRLSPRTVAKALTELKWALNDAVKKDRITRNPARHVRPPAPAYVERQWLKTPAELAQFVAAATTRKNGAFFVLMAFTGARPGELLALRWDDVVNGRLVIRRALTSGRAATRELGGTKTRRSRVLSLGSDENATLEMHRQQQDAERLAAGESYKNEGLIFASEIGTPLSMQNLTRRTFRPILDAAKLPVMRPYDLRHSALSILASHGVDPKLIAARAGHASIATTYKTYIHLRDDAQDVAVDVMQTFAATGRKKLESTAVPAGLGTTPLAVVRGGAGASQEVKTRRGRVIGVA